MHNNYFIDDFQPCCLNVIQYLYKVWCSRQSKYFSQSSSFVGWSGKDGAKCEPWTMFLPNLYGPTESVSVGQMSKALKVEELDNPSNHMECCGLNYRLLNDLPATSWKCEIYLIRGGASCHIVPVTRLEAFRAPQFSRLEKERKYSSVLKTNKNYF